MIPIVSTVVRKTTHAVTVSADDIKVARAGRLCPLRQAVAELFPDLIVWVGIETFSLRRPDGEQPLVARGVLPYNAQHFLWLYDYGQEVRGVSIHLTVEWYEDLA
jgi:hypothetical protein